MIINVYIRHNQRGSTRVVGGEKSVCDDESHLVSEVGNSEACRFAATVSAGSDVDDEGTNTHGLLGRQVRPRADSMSDVDPPIRYSQTQMASGWSPGPPWARVRRDHGLASVT